MERAKEALYPLLSGCLVFFHLLFCFSGCTEDLCFEEPGWDEWERIGLPAIVNYGYYYLCAAESSAGELVVGSWGRVFIRSEHGQWRRYYLSEREEEITAIAGSEDGLLFASQNPGGVFVSGDNGRNWEQVNNRLPSIFVNDLAVTPEGLVFAATEGGIFVTGDDGRNWSACSGGAAPAEVFCLESDREGVIYAGAGNVYVSRDQGQSWTEMDGVLDNRRIRDITLSPDGSVYAVSGRMVGRLKSGETVWEDVSPDGITARIEAVAVDKDGNIYAAEGRNGVHISTDDGRSWKRSGNGVYDTRIFDLSAFSDGVVACSRSVLKTADGGRSWQIMNPGYPEQSYYDWDYIMVDDTGGLVAGNETYGLYYSPDGGDSWIELWDRLYMEDVTCRYGKVYCVSRSFLGIFDPLEGSASTVQVIESDNNTLKSVGVDRPGRIYTGNCKEGIFRSADGGETWLHLGNPFGEGYMDFQPLDIITTTEGLIYLSVNRQDLYRSEDDGASWKKLDSNAVSLDIAPDGTLLALWEDLLYASTDNGQTWNRRKNMDFPVYYHPFDCSRLAIAENGHTLLYNPTFMYHSTDLGTTWYRDHSIDYHTDDYYTRKAAFGPFGYIYTIGDNYILKSSKPVY